jgi:hypothetical protein
MAARGCPGTVALGDLTVYARGSVSGIVPAGKIEDVDLGELDRLEPIDRRTLYRLLKSSPS